MVKHRIEAILNIYFLVDLYVNFIDNLGVSIFNIHAYIYI